MAAGGPSADSRLTLWEVEGGHVERAACRLGVPRSSLYERIKRLGIAVRRE